jgi:hypothetical protein
MPWAIHPANPAKGRRSATFRRFATSLECHFGADLSEIDRGDAILSGMADKDKASGMKSAYELALERMEKQGIERPREESFGDELREKIAETRRKAEAKIAELEILHKNSLKSVYDPGKRQEDEEEYRRERRRIEEDRDRRIEELRKG